MSVTSSKNLKSTRLFVKLLFWKTGMLYKMTQAHNRSSLGGTVHHLQLILLQIVCSPAMELLTLIQKYTNRSL